MTAAKILTALLFIGLNFYTYNYLAANDVAPPRETFESFPDAVGDWRCIAREKMDAKTIDNLGVTDYLLCNYANEATGAIVNAYVGYHVKQERSDSGKTTIIHPPEHCLPGSGWDIIDSSFVDIGDIEGAIPGEAKRVVVAKGNERNLVYFWYQSRGRVISGAVGRILWMFFDRATRSRTDGSLVRITIPLDHTGAEVADARFRAFASAFVPALPPYVPD